MQEMWGTSHWLPPSSYICYSQRMAKMQHFTEAEATDEAMLLLSRKLRRLHPGAFANIWSKLPEGAHRAIYAAERRADVVRDQGGKEWEETPDLDEDE